MQAVSSDVTPSVDPSRSPPHALLRTDERHGSDPAIHLPTARALRGSSALLVAAVWLSAGLFGLYILAFYVAAFSRGDLGRWNEVLPNLYDPRTRAASAGIGLHFVAGGVILVLGSVQLLDGLRARRPAVHRWIGRIYVTAAALAGVGGLVFILRKGTIGGAVMDVGFSLYGAFMILTAVLTWRRAVARDLHAHRAWAVRLYALAIGSWLYRMDYGFWALVAGNDTFTSVAGHTDAFNGAFDRVMDFFFFVPNLIIAELWIRARRRAVAPWLRGLTAGALLFATLLLLLGTYFFTRYSWGPAIVAWLA